MRRLTLILSDLYLPEEAVRDASLPQALELPQLDELLRFAATTRIVDWRRWLGEDLGGPDLATVTAATLASQAIPTLTDAKSVWLATPVHLEPRLDHVRMLERGLPRLAAAERAEWCEEFARAFSPFALHDAGARGFLLTGLAPARVTTADPARLLDADIAPALPTGPAARELRRLAAEIEMWMHAAPINRARERAGLQALSSLWLWGGGPLESVPLDTPVSTTAFHGDDPALAGLARVVTGAMPAEVPAGFAALRGAAERVVVEMMPMNGAAQESLQALDSNWFGPARAALASRSLASLDIVANDRWFHIAAGSRWQFWRRRVRWLTQLGHHAAAGSA